MSNDLEENEGSGGVGEVMVLQQRMMIANDPILSLLERIATALEEANLLARARSNAGRLQRAGAREMADNSASGKAGIKMECSVDEQQCDYPRCIRFADSDYDPRCFRKARELGIIVS